jgi:peptidoglycan hydrolase-like protein with peptidoglycan-binding domain
VTKFSLILPICFAVVSGCALSDSQEVASESFMAIPARENEPIATTPIVESAQPEDPPMPPRRTLTNDDVRRLQAGLREIGFDPGPVDGVVGTRTKSAYIRLHTACAKGGPALESFNVLTAERESSGATLLIDKRPNREETRKIQNQLRSAGFDPGPVDGIFGSKTQSALRQFQSGCILANGFEALLDDRVPAAVTATNNLRPPEATMSSANSPSDYVEKHSAAVQPREEVRILQLRLRDAGFDPGPFDGVMGRKTRSALAQYEASQRGKKIKTSLTGAGITGQY